MVDAAFLSAPLPWLDAITPAARFLVALIVCVLAGTFLWYLPASIIDACPQIPVRIHVAGTRGKSATVRLIAPACARAGTASWRRLRGRGRKSSCPTERSGRCDAGARQRSASSEHLSRQRIVQAPTRSWSRRWRSSPNTFTRWSASTYGPRISSSPMFGRITRSNSAPRRARWPMRSSETVPFGGRVFLTSEAAVPVVVATGQPSQDCEVSTVTCDPDADPEDANLRLALDVCRRYGVFPRMARTPCAPRRGTSALLPLPRCGSMAERSASRTPSPATTSSRSSGSGAVTSPRGSLRHSCSIREPIDRFAPGSSSSCSCGSRRMRRLLVIGGDPTLRRQAIAAGFSPEHLHRLPRRITEDTLRLVAAAIEQGTVVWGVGNFRGAGAKLSALAEAARAPC